MKNLDKNSYAYQKYVKPIKDREKFIKFKHITDWLTANILSLLSLVVAILSLIVSIIALNKTS